MAFLSTTSNGSARLVAFNKIFNKIKLDKEINHTQEIT